MHKLFIASLCLFNLMTAAVRADLSEPKIIYSDSLGYDVRYWVYTPPAAYQKPDMASLYVTDGQWYLRDGKMAELLDTMIAAGQIEPVTAVFVDSQDVHDKKRNRRTEQFFCNSSYATFFGTALIPAVHSEYPVSADRKKRVIMGLSFGGTNAACFSLMLPNLFGGAAMQSPANDQHLKLLRNLFKKNAKTDVKLFLSFGKKNDNLKAGKRFKRVLTRQGYDLTYHEVQADHSWKNWRPLLDDVLLTFFAR